MDAETDGRDLTELLEFLAEAREFVCVSGRQFYRFARGDFSLRRFAKGLEFQTGFLCLRTENRNWRRSTHRFAIAGRNGGVLLKPSRKNELWLRRQRFRWHCEDAVGGRWKLVRSSFTSSQTSSGVFLRIILQKQGSWFVAIAAGEEEAARAEAVLSQLFVLWRKFELSSGRRVEQGLLFIPTELAEAVASLLDDLRSPVRIYCLPGLAPFFPPKCMPVPLLWPSQIMRSELKELQEELAFPAEVQAVIRNGHDCSFEYLGTPFAIYEVDEGIWRFPLRSDRASAECIGESQSTLPAGNFATGVVREEYHRLRENRRPHARCRQDPLYQHYAERWLESLIVRDPKLLDAQLRAFPVYTQVPAYVTRRRVIDLVGVTESGRLVVMEVKVQKSMDLLFQGLAYWRIVRQAQQQNAFQENGYFCEVKLSNEPPLLYCVTPLLALHPAQRHFAQWLHPEVQAYLIGINNDWRAGVKVLRRERLC